MVFRPTQLTGWLLVTFLVASAPNASAQAVTLPSGGASPTLSRSSSRLSTTINHADCVNEDQIKFSLNLTSRGSHTLAAWAGASCDVRSNPTTRNATTCWKVYAATLNTNYPVISVPVRSILYGRTLALGSSTTTVVASDGGTTGDSSASGVPAACDDKSGSTSAQNITLYLMLVDAAEAAPGTIAQWAATYKLAAPLPPNHVTVGVGDNLLVVQFSYDDTSARVDGALRSLRCGSASSSATSGNAEGLVDDVAYNVAVAATDSYENTGTLSSTACEVPQPVTGLFAAYRNAGGQAGGGNFSRKDEPTAAGAVLGFGAYLLLRRRQKSSAVARQATPPGRASIALVALQSGAPWHWGWALAHERGCADCLILIQQGVESDVEFAHRTERACRRLGRRKAVAVLGTGSAGNVQFSTPRALIAHLKSAGSTDPRLR